MVIYYILGCIVFLTLIVVGYILFTFSKETPGQNEVKIEPIINKDIFKDKAIELERQLTNALGREQEFKKKIDELEDELRISSEKTLVKAQESISALETLTAENKDLKERVLKDEQSYIQQFNLAQEQMQVLNQENAELKLQVQDSSVKLSVLQEQIALSKGQMEIDLAQARQMLEQVKAERDSFVASREASVQSVSMIAREFEEIKRSNELLLNEVEALRLDNQKLKELSEHTAQKNQSLHYDLAKFRAQASGLEKICENYKLQLMAKV